MKRKKINRLISIALLCLVICLTFETGAVQADDQVSFGAPSIATYEMKFDENERFELMGNADGRIAVLDKQSGFLYESNPQENDPLAIAINKTNLKSQLYITWADKAGNTQTKNSTTDCVNKGWLTYTVKENGGVRFNYEFQGPGITIPVEYSLNEKGLVASVVVSEITENSEEKSCYLTDITFLPFFGAADMDAEGYLLVPDGSGALLYFNNDKASYGAYSQFVYGRDSALVLEALTVPEETARLPIFGIKNGNNGYLAVISQGDTNASINASTSGTLNSYNNAYASFRYRSFTKSTFVEGNIYAGGGQGGGSTVTLTLSPLVPGVDRYTVEYLMLSKEDLSYVDMAKAYRMWLAENAGMSLEKTRVSAPFYLNLLGGLKMEQYILGFKFNILKPLTTFDQAEEILTEFKGLGVDDIAVKYCGWQKGGMESDIPAEIKFESKLGGKRGYNDLLEYTKENGIDLFPDFDFVNFYESGNGYSSNSDATQTVDATPSYQYTYNSNLLTKNVEESWKILTPTKVEKAVLAMLKKADKLSNSQIAFSTLGNMVYSDHARKKNGIDRTATKELWEELFSKTTEQFTEIMVDNGNAYTFPYATHIYNVPMNSTGFDIEDESVPFYQIVLHGYVSYSTEPLNLSAVPEQLLLKAVETGSSLSANLMYADNTALVDTKYNTAFSAHYGTWIETLAEYYDRTAEVLNLVAAAEIDGHEQLQSGVYCTTYSNGIRVYVNYNKQAVSVGGVSIPAEDFVYVQGGNEG